MSATVKSAWGYQGNPMTLPVENLDSAIPFYEEVLGFHVVSRGCPDGLCYWFGERVRDGLAL